MVKNIISTLLTTIFQFFPKANAKPCVQHVSMMINMLNTCNILWTKWENCTRKFAALFVANFFCLKNQFNILSHFFYFVKKLYPHSRIFVRHTHKSHHLISFHVCCVYTSPASLKGTIFKFHSALFHHLAINKSSSSRVCVCVCVCVKEKVCVFSSLYLNAPLKYFIKLRGKGNDAVFLHRVCVCVCVCVCVWYVCMCQIERH